jgi:hypothetical protein
VRKFIVAIGSVITLALPGVAQATPYVPPRLLVERPGTPAIPRRSDWTPPGITSQDLIKRLGLIAGFEKSMQYTGACTPDAGAGGDAGAEAGPCEFGGEIEVQSGPGNAIIESDNTQEAIWIWSWQRQLASDTSYAPQITNAFEFLSVFPGWLKWEETGDPGPDYYSIYNCAWGVRAVVELEAAWGDTSHHAYGAMCADHIQSYATIAPTGLLIDAATTAFAASGLWIWGKAQGDAALQQKAVDIGAEVKAWIDNKPSVVSSQTWAVTGAAAFDGVVGSYMMGHPEELVAWVQQTAPLLGGWIDESQPANPNDWTDWRNAHAAWNMIAQFDAATALGEGESGTHNQIALDIFSKLAAQDTQGNGAIPGSQQRENAHEDETWITAYLVYFGMRPLLADIQLDAGPSGDAAPEGGASDAGADASGPAAPPPSGASKGGGCHEAGSNAEGSAPLALLAAFAVCAWASRWRKRSSPRATSSRAP